jgi:hypothetical protein
LPQFNRSDSATFPSAPRSCVESSGLRKSMAHGGNCRRNCRIGKKA